MPNKKIELSPARVKRILKLMKLRDNLEQSLKKLKDPAIIEVCKNSIKLLDGVIDNYV